jgi:hypothetical protein
MVLRLSCFPGLPGTPDTKTGLRVSARALLLLANKQRTGSGAEVRQLTEVKVMNVRISRRYVCVVGAILLAAVIILAWPAIIFAKPGATPGGHSAKKQAAEKAGNAGILGVLNRMQDPQVADFFRRDSALATEPNRLVPSSAAGASLARPPMLQSWEVPGAFVPDNTPTVFLLSGAQKRNCPKAGTVCVAPGGSATMVGMVVRPSGPPLTLLARGTQVAGKGHLGKASSDQPWQVEMVSRFWAASKRLPIIVAIFDTADPESIARKEAKILWDVTMNPGRELGMRFLLAPEDGFEPSHTYLVRVVQAKSKWERILAEGGFHLE